MEEKMVGRVVKYFARPGVAAVELEGDVALGNTLHFKGHTTDFEQEVDSMQIENVSVQEARVGDSAGIKVKERARSGDLVYKVLK